MDTRRSPFEAFRAAALGWLAALVIAVPAAALGSGDDAQLGDAPRRDEPQEILGWRLLPQAIKTREAVASLYYGMYVPGDSVALSWTGAVASCNPGVTNPEHQQAVIDRVNYFRALVDLPAVSVLGGLPTTQAQAAALMMSANNALSHKPPATWFCYTTAGADGAGNSNLALGAYGVEAIDLYVDDPGDGNSAVGHRRWILFPPRAAMATGDVTSTSTTAPAANDLYVFGPVTTRPATPNGIAWPPAGFVPYQNLPSQSNRWSFSYPGAVMSGAKVTMTGPAGPIPVVLEPLVTGYGDNTIVFRPTGFSYAKPAADPTYAITVSGMTGSGVPPSIAYTVTVIDPASGPPPAPSLALTAEPNPSAFAQTVTFTATATGNVGIPTGSVTFRDGGSAIAACSMVALNGSGQAQCATASLAVGDHAITAQYSGDGVYPGMLSGTLIQVVNPPATLTFSPAIVDFGGVAVGQAASRTLTLINAGVTPIDLQTQSTTGDFALNGAAATCGATLAAGASCALGITFAPSALGTRIGTLSITSNAFAGPATAALTGTGLVGDYASTVAAVVTGYYETILGRAPDTGGRAFWIGEVARMDAVGANVSEVFYAMALEFFNSPEYASRSASDVQFLTDLYRTFFVRAPEAAGLAYWLGQLATGLPRPTVLNSFMFSAEFDAFMTGAFGSTGASRAEVSAVIDYYRGLLGRLPDTVGFEFWLGRFRGAQCEGAAAVSAEADTISQQFIGSPEYVLRNEARAPAVRTGLYVSDLYNAFMRRPVDLDGFLFWVGQIDSAAATREQARASFVGSPEFQSRVAAIIAQGCLP